MGGTGNHKKLEVRVVCPSFQASLVVASGWNRKLWNQSSMLHTLTYFVQYSDAMTDGAGHGSPQWHRADEKIL